MKKGPYKLFGSCREFTVIDGNLEAVKDLTAQIQILQTAYELLQGYKCGLENAISEAMFEKQRKLQPTGVGFPA